MRIWIDADACPRPVRDVVLRASERLGIPVTFVSNKALQLPRSPRVTTVQIGAGLNVADAHIEAHAQDGDLAVTQDIPLAAALVKKGLVTLDVRGELFTLESIEERLTLRNFMQEMRESGEVSGGPSAFGPQDKQRFAAALDRELTRLARPR